MSLSQSIVNIEHLCRTVRCRLQCFALSLSLTHSLHKRWFACSLTHSLTQSHPCTLAQTSSCFGIRHATQLCNRLRDLGCVTRDTSQSPDKLAQTQHGRCLMGGDTHVPVPELACVPLFLCVCVCVCVLRIACFIFNRSTGNLSKLLTIDLVSTYLYKHRLQRYW